MASLVSNIRAIVKSLRDKTEGVSPGESSTEDLEQKLTSFAEIIMENTNMKLDEYADDVEARADGGLVEGDLYHTAGTVKIVLPE